MSSTMMRTCPNCNKEFDWLPQILNWVEEYGQDWLSWAMFMINCPHCGEYAGSIDLVEGEMETEMVESEALPHPVKVPTGKMKEDAKN